jgi:hypothetical protein
MKIGIILYLFGRFTILVNREISSHFNIHIFAFVCQFPYWNLAYRTSPIRVVILFLEVLFLMFFSERAYFTIVHLSFGFAMATNYMSFFCFRSIFSCKPIWHLSLRQIVFLILINFRGLYGYKDEILSRHCRCQLLHLFCLWFAILPQ